MNDDDIWVVTPTGSAVHLLQPRPESVRLLDIATQLARLPRYNGGTKIGHGTTVATHSVMVMYFMPSGTPPIDRLHALLHDAHEAYIGDITTPLERAIAVLSGSEAVSHLKARLHLAIEQAAGIGRPDPLTAAAVRLADRQALAVEKRDLIHSDAPPWGSELPDVSKIAAKAFGESETEACRVFLFNFNKWATAAGLTMNPSFLHGLEDHVW